MPMYVLAFLGLGHTIGAVSLPLPWANQSDISETRHPWKKPYRRMKTVIAAVVSVLVQQKRRTAEAVVVIIFMLNEPTLSATKLGIIWPKKTAGLRMATS